MLRCAVLQMAGGATVRWAQMCIASCRVDLAGLRRALLCCAVPCRAVMCAVMCCDVFVCVVLCRVGTLAKGGDSRNGTWVYLGTSCSHAV